MFRVRWRGYRGWNYSERFRWRIAFKIDDVPTWKSLFGVGTRSVRAYGCVHCGRLQLAVDFSENDLLQYQQFEGEQPGVLERINSEPGTEERVENGTKV